MLCRSHVLGKIVDTDVWMGIVQVIMIKAALMNHDGQHSVNGSLHHMCKSILTEILFVHKSQMK